jgi:hypothetical protein
MCDAKCLRSRFSVFIFPRGPRGLRAKCLSLSKSLKLNIGGFMMLACGRFERLFTFKNNEKAPLSTFGARSSGRL